MRQMAQQYGPQVLDAAVQGGMQQQQMEQQPPQEG